MKSRYADVLTPREQVVLKLLATGLTNEEIARQLGISLDGVKYHVSGILRSLDVENRHDAVALHLRLQPQGGGRFAAWAPVIFLRKLPFAGLPHAAAGVVLTGTAVGIGLLAWGVFSTSSPAATTTSPTGCGAEQTAGSAPNCGPLVAPAETEAHAVSAISAAGSGTCAVKDGGVRCWGANGNGYFGRGKGATTDSSAPMAMPGLANAVSAIAGAGGSGCAIKDGGLWCWTTYMSDDLGDPDPGVCRQRYGGCIGSALSAVPALASGVTALSVSCAVKDGGAWCAGNNENPENSEDGSAEATATAAACHQGGACNIPVFVAVPGLESGVSAISGDNNFGCAVKDGGVWCWGSSGAGKFGNDGRKDSDAAVAVPVLASGVSAISVGGDHICALKDGGVWCWGGNFSRQLGNNGTDNPAPAAVSGLTTGVSAISAAGGYSCAVKDGGVWCWGDNSTGQLGNDNTTDVCGLNFFPCSHVPVAVSGLTGSVSAISAGGDHTCAVTDAGAWCWGNNAVGQLGNNRPKGSDAPVAVSGLTSGVSAISGSWDHSCALKGGAVSCWGANNNGQLGNNSTADSAVPVAVSGLASGVSAISAGACALKDDGLWCWGNLASGLAKGDSSAAESHVPVAVAGLADGVSAIIAGSAEAPCALKDGAVWCAGLGYPGNTVSVTVPGFESGVSAISGSCGLKDGGVWCWGWGEGDGSGNGTLRSARPVPGLASGVSATTDGCALKDGGVWCWGGVGYGQQADRPLSAAEPVAGLASGVSAISQGFSDPWQSCALKEGGVWCWGSSDAPGGAVPVAMPGLESGVSAISWNCALKDGGVWCWGDNSRDQLGNGSPADSLVPAAVQFPP